eukprot:CAMPEP_0174251008 /NCGR_PEP_ID=MMETSP0439-20130205/980_1 /TAXON_ID=0 /ORGANISM="Stereomyxa ramosa, Strain Chinc5" /LENGTH=474 /DNA_ID=CAMNT_0015331223 /DNA_START=40 /DNA_END=1464 /DNA_ORIENTATION=+
MATQDLVKRLEEVCSRLEAVERQLGSGGGSAPRSGGGGGGGASSSPGGSDSQSLRAFDQFTTQIDEYVRLSAKIGPLVKQQADLVKRAIVEERKILAAAAACKKPSDQDFMKMIQPCSALMGQVVEIREKSRGHEHFDHLSTLSEGIAALGWITITPTPGPFVDEARASSEFYSNKLLMKYKRDESERGQDNMEWVKNWNTWLKDLRAYIKDHHTTGLVWSGSQDPTSFSGGASPAPAQSAPQPSRPKIGGGGPGNALFAEINSVKDRQKGGRTEGLRKVTKDMKTKNQERGPAVVPSSSPKKAPARKWGGGGSSQPPKFALEGNKWVVEFQKGNKQIVIQDVEVRHTVYIYKCEDSVIQIKGKVNAITIDNCKKTGLVFEDAVSVVEVVNCQSVQVQVTGRVPSVTVDKTSGCQIFVSEAAKDVEIVTAKSDELNVVLPPKSSSDDITEIAIPEQFKTVIVNDKLVTEAVQHV